MKMREAFEELRTIAGKIPFCATYSMTSYAAKPCMVYIENRGVFYGDTWEAAMRNLNGNGEKQVAPDEEYTMSLNKDFMVGQQPCQNFKPDKDGHKFVTWDNRHECYKCGSEVSFCLNCMWDHHLNGYESCKKDE